MPSLNHYLVVPLLNDPRAKPNPTATPIPCDECGATCRLSTETAEWLSNNPSVTAIMCLDCAQVKAAEADQVGVAWAGDPSN